MNLWLKKKKKEEERKKGANLKLAERGEEPSTEGLDFVVLPAKAELDGKPVDLTDREG